MSRSGITIHVGNRIIAPRIIYWGNVLAGWLTLVIQLLKNSIRYSILFETLNELNTNSRIELKVTKDGTKIFVKIPLPNNFKLNQYSEVLTAHRRVFREETLRRCVSLYKEGNKNALREIAEFIIALVIMRRIGLLTLSKD